MIGTLQATMSKAVSPESHVREGFMLEFKKLVLPLDLEEPSMAAVHQVALLARHFHSEIVIVHAIRPFSYLGLHEKDLDEYLHHVQHKIDATLGHELDGLNFRRVILKGDPARIIMEIAAEEKTGVIVVGPHGYAGLAGRLMGSVTEKILGLATGPVWSSAHLEKTTAFPPRRILCGVNFTSHDFATVRWAAAMAADFQAPLTLAHVTAGTEIYGPGGYHEIPEMKQALVSGATQHLQELQRETGLTDSELFVGSGDVGKVLSHAAQETGSDLLVIGHRPSVGSLSGHCYSIICKSNIPVLAV